MLIFTPNEISEPVSQRPPYQFVVKCDDERELPAMQYKFSVEEPQEELTDREIISLAALAGTFEFLDDAAEDIY